MAMEHYLIRATIIPEIVKMIEKEYHLPEREALKAFYMSATGASLADDAQNVKMNVSKAKMNMPKASKSLKSKLFF